MDSAAKRTFVATVVAAVVACVVVLSAIGFFVRAENRDASFVPLAD